MTAMVLGSWLVTRKLSTGTRLTRWQNLLEVLVSGMRKQISDISQQESAPFLPFVGSLFLFVATCNLLAIIPGYEPPTGSLSTTAGLAACVFVAVPLYGISRRGGTYFSDYIKPSIFMLPFNIMGELSRTLALAVRLFGNVMSGSMIAAILLAVAPLVFPVLMQVLGLLTGLIQAYIFSILAMVYIAAAVRVRKRGEKSTSQEVGKGDRSHG
jgi:F-type H+-transporting ATPase subunit a